MPKKGQLTGHFIKCENCGKDIYKTNYLYNKSEHHFCSNKCQKEYQHKEAYEYRKCEVCGIEYEVSKKSSQRFCSTNCQNGWQKTLIGDLNPRSNRMPAKCDYCGDDIKIMPCEQKLFKYHFCSDNCRVLWYREVFSQDENWKNISRIRATELLKNNKSTTNTKPQILTNNILDELKIEYENEKNFVYYAVDNYLIDSNLIIEVMGDYWHASPLKYEYENLRSVQKKRIPKDKAKHTYILHNYNIEILYLWESDLLNNYEKCKRLIEMYINNYGILQNYHSFNYNYNNNNISLNKEIIIPYQDINIT